jgi:hypothetical protein
MASAITPLPMKAILLFSRAIATSCAGSGCKGARERASGCRNRGAFTSAPNSLFLSPFSGLGVSRQGIYSLAARALTPLSHIDSVNCIVFRRRKRSDPNPCATFYLRNHWSNCVFYRESN